MSYLRKGTIVGSPLKFSWKPELECSSLIIGWSIDVSKVGAKVTDYLITRLKGKSFCEMEPAEFFPMRGVVVEDDVVQFPEGKFYACPDKDLVIFKSSQPSYEWYRFLNLVLDVAEQYCHVRELYTVGGTVAASAHTTPPYLLSTTSTYDLKDDLTDYDLRDDLYYETPPEQRPTMSAYLLWIARQRNIAGSNLWVPVPFYLARLEDPRAQKRVLDFINRRFTLGLDFSDLDGQIKEQNEMIASVRNNSAEVDKALTKLENNLRLTEEESQLLLREVENLLGRGGKPLGFSSQQ